MVVNGVSLSPGSAVMVRLVSVAGPPGATAQPGGTAAAAPALAAGAGAGLPAAPYAPSAGVAAPWVAPSGVAQADPNSVLTGTVLPGGSATRTFVQTAAGTLAIAGRIAAPPGAEVGLEVLRAAAPPGPAALAGGAPAATPLFSATAWPSLTEALQVLGGSDAEAARRLAAVLPQADSRMVANIAGYTAAVHAGGEVRQWPGAGIMRALERAGERGERVAKALKGELTEASSVRRDATGTEWRVTTLPFHVGHEVQRIQMISRRQSAGDSDDGDGDGAGGGKGSGQRFLITLELSRLGALQIDGLFRKGDRRFDLILRTHQTLPQEMRRDLSGLFASTLGALGLKGGLGFHVAPRFETPLPDLAPPTDRPGLFA